MIPPQTGQFQNEGGWSAAADAIEVEISAELWSKPKQSGKSVARWSPRPNSAAPPASSRVRCMNPRPQHRLVFVLRHVQRLCVSLDSDRFADPHVHVYRAPRRDSSLCHLSLQLARTATNSNFENHRDLLNHIQNP